MAQLGLPDGGWLHSQATDLSTRPARSLGHADLGRRVRITTEAGMWVGNLHKVSLFAPGERIYLGVENNGAKGEITVGPDHPIEFL